MVSEKEFNDVNLSAKQEIKKLQQKKDSPVLSSPGLDRIGISIFRAANPCYIESRSDCIT